MQARLVAAARGARWLAEGWRLFRAAPLGWLALVFAYWLLMTLVSLIPALGVAVDSVLVPAFSVGFMAAARAASRGAKLELALLFEGLRNERRAQLMLGAAYLASLALVLGASAALDGGALARWMLTGERPGDEALHSGDFLAALACAGALYVPVMMAFWFAPALAAWHGTGAAKALFFSFFGCLINWRAFLAYGAVTSALSLGLPFVVLAIMALASGGEAQLAVMTFVFPLLILLLPTLFASFYASYRDVFGSLEKSEKSETAAP
ncbi:MAG TPA: BPSS1780 family membrane protein [Burkholderiales bacterium]